MKKAVQILIKPNNYPSFFDFCEEKSEMAKLLYNAALFRIRQVFTGWRKEKRSANEE